MADVNTSELDVFVHSLRKSIMKVPHTAITDPSHADADGLVSRLRQVLLILTVGLENRSHDAVLAYSSSQDTLKWIPDWLNMSGFRLHADLHMERLRHANTRSPAKAYLLLLAESTESNPVVIFSHADVRFRQWSGEAHNIFKIDQDPDLLPDIFFDSRLNRIPTRTPGSTHESCPYATKY
jgi:hypothetical protein